MSKKVVLSESATLFIGDVEDSSLLFIASHPKTSEDYALENVGAYGYTGGGGSSGTDYVWVSTSFTSGIIRNHGDRWTDRINPITHMINEGWEVRAYNSYYQYQVYINSLE